jgi:membrane-bound inhibitor of C-type lysozyme
MGVWEEEMNHKGIWVVVGILVMTFFCGSALAAPGRLSVAAGKAVTYVCDNGDRILATYYQLSDGSLSFVKVRLPDAKEHTLPQALSASGSRYTDERELVWWIKGDAAFAEVRDAGGEWKPKYRDCRVAGEGRGSRKAVRRP